MSNERKRNCRFIRGFISVLERFRKEKVSTVFHNDENQLENSNECYSNKLGGKLVNCF